MITAITAENVNAYKALFEDASDILSGYKKVRTFDTEVSTYFYKDAAAETAEELFKPVENINSLLAFATALKNYGILYVQTADGLAEGYDPMMGITTLEEYFSWLKTLGNINRKYTVLPLGEEVFDINANTRAITVPVNYKKNGVGVQGDDLAEVLYFRIDRYFDYMDFNNTDIFIQWETPKAKDGTVIKSVSPAYIRDIESEPGKLIFGWALSDAITAQAGALKFSVRFYQWANSEAAQDTEATKTLAYSFSTLTSTVSINPSINLDIEKDKYEIDDCGDRLIERLENSVVAGGYAAAVPEFEVNLADKTEGYDLDADGTYELLVQAFAADTGAIGYTWKKQDLNADNTTTDAAITAVDSVNKFVPVEDMNNLNAAYAYYKENGTDEEGNLVYNRYTGTIPPTAEEADGLTLYTKQSMCVADNYGIYWAVAENRITNSVSHAESVKAKFLRPNEVKIATQPEAKVILGEDGATLSVFYTETDKSDVTFEWYHDANSVLNFGDEEPAFELMPEQTANIINVTDEGHYKVRVINTRNKDSKYLDSSISRVTKPAEIAVVEMPETTADRLYDIAAITDENCPYVEIMPVISSDYYTVAWYRNGEKDPIIVDELIGKYLSKFNPITYAEKDENGQPIIADALGVYYPIITNYLNGDKAATEKPDNVDDMFTIVS